MSGMPSDRRSRLFAALLVSCASVAGVRAQASSEPAPLGKGATESLVARYDSAEHWLQKVVVLLSLNRWWHPAGADMIVAAVTDRDERLQAFGVEALLRSDPEVLPSLATAPLLDELITKQLRDSNDHYRARVLAALQLLAPDAGCGDDKSEWSKWWYSVKETYQPKPWQAKEQPAGDGSGTAAVAQRAFDLYQAGLDLMICIDSTGSMQATIDALGAALGEMVDMLDGISPKLRIGIVHYKDRGELGKQGAEVEQKFTKNVKTVRKRLEKLRAMGGGDLPEAVLGGLEVALDKKQRWEEQANKLVVLIGDAPPHDQDKQALVELARTAYEKPGEHDSNGRPTTGPKADVAPFRVCTMGVFVKLGADVKAGPGFAEFQKAQERMRQDFGEVAKAGGGVFVEVDFTINSATPPTSKERREMREQRGGAADLATRKIVEHILVLSFGERYTKEMQEFVRIYYAYVEAGFFD